MREIRKDILLAEFLDELEERAQRDFKGHLHRAFVSWYVEAEFGQVTWDFTDDKSDGGIDALVWLPDEVPPILILQSKFTENIGRTALGRSAYREFQGVVDAFFHGEEVFDEFLSRVRLDLRAKYRKALEALEGIGHWAHEKKAFRLITTNNRRAQAEFPRIPKSAFLYADAILRLYRQYREGETPRARDLVLGVEATLPYEDQKTGVTSYLFNARLADFRKYLEKNDVARLVARNIRYELGGRIGRGIRTTYEKAASEFWYLHNGLTILCDDFVERNRVATLTNPSVINGAQTLYAISHSSKKESPALVTARVIVRGDNLDDPIEDDAWLQRVIRGVNTQNRVREYDFRANDPEQITLQKRFRDFKVFYERKRGEWKEFRNEPRFRGFDRLTLPKLGQILTAVSDDNGHGVLFVKKGLDDIFEEKYYRQLFPSRSRVAKRFEKIYLAYRVHRLLEDYGYADASEARQQRHAFWNTLWILHRGITDVERLHTFATVRSVKDTFDRFEARGRVGQRARKSLRSLTRVVWNVWRQARRSDPERWTPNNFFKSTFGNRRLLRFAFPKVRSDLRGLGRLVAGR